MRYSGVLFDLFGTLVAPFRMREHMDALRECAQHLATQLPADVAVVTHGGSINIVYQLLKGLPWSNKNPTSRAGWRATSKVDHL